jgi:protein TonB
MQQGGFFEQKRTSPTTLATVVVLHAAALGALLLAKGTEVFITKDDPTDVIFVPLDPDPPPQPPERQPEQQLPRQHESVVDRVPPVVQVPPRGPVATGDPIPPQPWNAGPIGSVTQPIPPAPPIERPTPIPPEPIPVPDPVRVEARLDSRGSELQPPYPPSEEAAEREGSVVIRVMINPQGRVSGVERVRATSEAFYAVTERHVRSRWRFRPATVDGRPIESLKVMTVHFELSNR